jgi:hypothetical protein
MVAEQLSPLVPIEVRNETERDPLGKLVDRREHRGRFQVFRVDPQLPEGKQRTVELLARSDIATAIVHIMKTGGENQFDAPYYFSATSLDTTIVIRFAAQSTEVPNEQLRYATTRG